MPNLIISKGMEAIKRMKQIAILMAVYDPNPAWLAQQLDSLEKQTYRPLRLYVRDDASPNFPFERLEALVAEHIRSFSAECARNEHNLGSNATFGLLTYQADSALLAYCDQDDVWEPDKLQKLATALENENAQLACCDLSVIDADGRQTARSLHDVKPHIVYRSGEGLASAFLTTNFVTGCACVVRAEASRAALPFPQYTVHDQWLALCAAQRGSIAFVPEALVRYRIHGENQTPTLKGVHTKKDYYAVRIARDQRRIAEFGQRVDLGMPQRRLERWMAAREALAAGSVPAWFRLVWLCNVDAKVSLLELALPLIPEKLFQRVLARIQHGQL